jgi:hypothetical protein
MITDLDTLSQALENLLRLPRAEQPAAAVELSEGIDLGVPDEAWNSRFGEDSLFSAWTGSGLLSGLYAGNAAVLADHLKSGWRTVEVGGGDGRLWSLLPELPEGGELTLVDPMLSTHEQVRLQLSSRVGMASLQGRVEDVLPQLPQADAIVCSLTLHHVAGRCTQERESHGLAGPGKLEVLRAFKAALSERRGLLILNEADVHCDLGLLPGDPLLADRLMDSYVRRTAVTLAREIREGRGDPLRLGRIIQRWCLAEVAMADAPVAERDVYELDVPRWLCLLEEAGFEVLQRGFSDSSMLFHRYVCR